MVKFTFEPPHQLKTAGNKDKRLRTIRELTAMGNGEVETLVDEFIRLYPVDKELVSQYQAEGRTIQGLLKDIYRSASAHGAQSSAAKVAYSECCNQFPTFRYLADKQLYS